jgi:hypothetical protein
VAVDFFDHLLDDSMVFAVQTVGQRGVSAMCRRRPDLNVRVRIRQVDTVRYKILAAGGSARIAHAKNLRVKRSVLIFRVDTQAYAMCAGEVPGVQESVRSQPNPSPRNAP